MRAFIAVFFIALMVTAISTPWVRRLAMALGFVDAPHRRKLHHSPMPLMGGMAMLVGAILAVLLFYGGTPPRTVSGVLLATTVVALVGLWDDRHPLPAWAKLAGQCLGGVILIQFGIRVQLPIPEFLNYAITFIWLIGISNAINFLDNMDGLSAGISGVAAAFMLLLALMNGQFLVGALAAALLGATLGFLRYNFKPARIFMGDVGALFLGFFLAVLGIQLRFPGNSNAVTWMVPLFLLGLPIFDTTLVVISRIRRGLSPNTAGKDHTSHRLVRLGLSQREAVLALYLLSGALGMIAIFITQATILEAYLVAAVVGLLALYGIGWLEKQWIADDGQ
jgi:UDP-GlcNAc:undecaprenyl-phosphate GlcNAc-1-phosphate transferase